MSARTRDTVALFAIGLLAILAVFTASINPGDIVAAILMQL